MEEETFTGLGVSRPVADALAKRGITVPFAIQSRVIPDGLAGRDVLAQSPTGSGKTLAFGDSARRAADADDAAACGTRAGADARARDPGGRGAVGSRPRRAGLAVCAVYGGAPLRSQAKRAQMARDPGGDARPAAGT